MLKDLPDVPLRQDESTSTSVVVHVYNRHINSFTAADLHMIPLLHSTLVSARDIRTVPKQFLRVVRLVLRSDIRTRAMPCTLLGRSQHMLRLCVRLTSAVAVDVRLHHLQRQVFNLFQQWNGLECLIEHWRMLKS